MLKKPKNIKIDELDIHGDSSDQSESAESIPESSSKESEENKDEEKENEKEKEKENNGSKTEEKDNSILSSIPEKDLFWDEKSLQNDIPDIMEWIEDDEKKKEETKNLVTNIGMTNDTTKTKNKEKKNHKKIKR